MRGVPPPSVLEGTEQVGFSDVLVDDDGIIRRALLYLESDGQVVTAFGMRLAQLYLKAEGISPQPDPSDPGKLRLGPTTLEPFQASDGGYIRADARGYQILLDFKGGGAEPTTFSLTASSSVMETASRMAFSPQSALRPRRFAIARRLATASLVTLRAITSSGFAPSPPTLTGVAAPRCVAGAIAATCEL